MPTGQPYRVYTVLPSKQMQLGIATNPKIAAFDLQAWISALD